MSSIAAPPTLSYPAAFAAVPGLYLILQPDASGYRIVAANEAYLRATRREQSDLVGQDIFEAFPEHPGQHTLSILRTSLNRVVTQRQTDDMGLLRYDLPRTTEGGKVLEERYWQSKNIPILDAAGTVSHVIHATEDVTQRTRAEQDRSNYFAVATDLLIKTDLDGCMREISPACEKILGWKATELVDRQYLEFVAAVDLKSSREALNEIVAGQEAHHFVNRFRCPDGSHRWLSWNTRTLTDEGIIYWAAADVTLARRLQAITEGQKRALEMSVHGDPLVKILDLLLRTLEANASAGLHASILLFDPAQGRLRFGAAPSLPVMAGMPKAGIPIGMRQGSCGVAAYTGRSYAAFDVATDPAWSDHRDALLALNLRSCWSSPIRSGSGEMLGTFALYYDRPAYPTPEKLQLVEILSHTAATVIERERNVEARRQIERELIRARNAAENANLAKSNFLANMSHEIRTPMNVIVGISDLLGSYEQLTPEQTNLVQNLQRSADALLVLINDLLDLSKIEAQGVELEEHPFRLADLVNGVAAMLSLRAEQKGIQISTEGLDRGPDAFLGDPGRLRQIVLNLSDNAVKFTERGGVTLRVRKQREGDGSTCRVKLEVEDTGIGIAADQLAHIFQPFTQADASVTRRYGGTGLGLSITRKLAELMDGTVTVRSSPGRGSTFTLSLPLRVDIRADRSGQGPQVDDPERTHDRAGRVLLVEDFAPNAFIAGRYLRIFGYVHDLVANGQEAIRLATRHAYAAILMDIQMPGMNGLEATARIRDHERRTGAARTPIIAMTARAMKGDRERCLAAGMDDYLTKPFRSEDLRETLERLTRR